MVIAQGDVCWADIPDRIVLTERVGRVSRKQLTLLFAGIDLVLGR